MTFDEIIAAMERGETGRELDADISVALGIPGHMTIGDGVVMEERRVPNHLPPYTTSLDAKIPGEDIVTVYAPNYGNRDIQMDQWFAYNRYSRDGCPRGFGPTEIAARRAAGLRAWKERT